MTFPHLECTSNKHKHANTNDFGALDHTCGCAARVHRGQTYSLEEEQLRIGVFVSREGRQVNLYLCERKHIAHVNFPSNVRFTFHSMDMMPLPSSYDTAPS